MRIVLTGSESTGKTTLAAALAEHYGAELVPEFVREFAARKGAPIAFDDHGAIARGQMALEDEHIARARTMIIQDTDLLSTVVYCAHYFDRCPPWIEEAAASRRPDLYLLCDIDIPWVVDGIRDREHARDEIQALFRAALRASEVPVMVIHGTCDERFRRAVDAIDAIRSEPVNAKAPPRATDA
jgi:NadR type nicotinamide-nucleotide adenylyltransferase